MNPGFPFPVLSFIGFSLSTMLPFLCPVVVCPEPLSWTLFPSPPLSPCAFFMPVVPWVAPPAIPVDAPPTPEVPVIPCAVVEEPVPAAPAPKAVPPEEALVWPNPEVEPMLFPEAPPLREMPAFWSKPEPVAFWLAIEEEFIPPELDAEVVDILFPVIFVPVVEVFIPC